MNQKFNQNLNKFKCVNVCTHTEKKLHWLFSLPPKVLKAKYTKKSQMNIKIKNISESLSRYKTIRSIHF